MTKVIKAPSGEYYYCSPLVEHEGAEFYLYRNHAENSLGLFRVSMKNDTYIVPAISSYKAILDRLRTSARDLDPVGTSGYATLFPEFVDTWQDGEQFVTQLSITGTSLGDDEIHTIEQISQDNRLTLRDSAKLLLKMICLMQIYEAAGYQNRLSRFSYGWLLNCTTNQAVFYHCDGVLGVIFGYSSTRAKRRQPLYGIFHSKDTVDFRDIAYRQLQLVGYDDEEGQYLYGVLPERERDYLNFLKGIRKSPPSSIENFLQIIVQSLDTAWINSPGGIQLLPR